MGAGVALGCELMENLCALWAALPTYIKEALRILLGVSPKPTRTLRGLPKGKPLIHAFYFPHRKDTGVPQGLEVPALLSFLHRLHRTRRLGGAVRPLLVGQP